MTTLRMRSETFRRDFDRNADWLTVNEGPEAVRAWNEIFAVPPKALRAKLADGLPADCQVQMECDLWTAGPSTFTVKVMRGDDKLFSGEFRRSADGSRMQFCLIEASRQGQGMGRLMIGNCTALFREMGVKKLTLTAALSAGGYAWARFGFVPNRTSWADLKSSVAENLKNLGRAVSPADRAIINVALASSDPRGIWIIADGRATAKGQPLGRQLLAGTSWDGELDFSQADQRNRLDAYIASVPKPLVLKPADPDPDAPSGRRPGGRGYGMH